MIARPVTATFRASDFLTLRNKTTGKGAVPPQTLRVKPRALRHIGLSSSFALRIPATMPLTVANKRRCQQPTTSRRNGKFCPFPALVAGQSAHPHPQRQHRSARYAYGVLAAQWHSTCITFSIRPVRKI